MEDWLEQAAQRRPDHPAIETIDGVLITFDELHERVERMAGSYRSTVLGSVVGLWAINEWQTVETMCALWRAGAAVHLIDPRQTRKIVAEQLSRSGARFLAGRSGQHQDIESIDSAEAGSNRQPGCGDDAWIIFTSGSTGDAKGVRLTFSNLEASAAASAVVLRHGPDDRWLCNLPLSHVGGASIVVRSLREATTVIMDTAFDAERTARLCSRRSVTLASFVAASLSRTLDRLEQPCHGVRAALVGGGPVPPGLVRRSRELGIHALPTYGMTETASQIATAPLGDAGAGLEPIPGAEIMVRDDGRILVRGAMVSAGYLGASERAEDQWHVTGDLGRIDVSGRLEVLGRSDDVIVTGGEKVHPAEVEAELNTHPGVDDVVVFGVPDAIWGEVVTAVYEGSAAPGELERHARFHLSGFKVPRRWNHVERLPRLAVGKVDRRALRSAVQ